MGLGCGVSTPAFATAEEAGSLRSAVLIEDRAPAAGYAATAGHLQRHGSTSGRIGRVAQQHDRRLPFVVEHHVEHAVTIHVDETNRLGVENPLMGANLFGRVLECSVALVAKESIRPPHTTYYQIQ